MMKKMMMLLIVALMSGTLMIGAGPARGDDILDFGTMAPVPEIEFEIRGVPGAGSAWVLDKADGSLSENGDLEIDVRGLVLADSLTNPLLSFAGAVSCMTGDGGFVNLMTGLFEADEEGNAEIDATLLLPSPCFAPIVFVTTESGSWLAVTGGNAVPDEVDEEVDEDVDDDEEDEDVDEDDDEDHDIGTRIERWMRMRR